MKNIHIIPTDKPSRLLFDKEENRLLPLQEVDFWMEHQNLMENQHIYITSDEEIKEGDFFIMNGSVIRKCDYVYGFMIIDTTQGKHHFSVCKKIILTDNKDLIADGVQAIDDEFLEWFVKNPSCEEVEVFKDFFQVNQNNPVLKGSTALVESYKIIIPIEGTPQETNEEASKRIYPDKTTPGYIDHWSATERRCFIEGAQWSQEEILYFLYEELTERRPYSSSKMCEVVIEFIQKMNKK